VNYLFLGLRHLVHASLVVLTPDVAANRVSEPAEIGCSLVSTACGVLAPFLSQFCIGVAATRD
jgi:hypothetical protein